MTMLHPHGRQGPAHPPRHRLATSGGEEAQGARWEPLQDVPYESSASHVAVARAAQGAPPAPDGGDPPGGGGVFWAVAQRPGAQRPEGRRPLAVSQRGA